MKSKKIKICLYISFTLIAWLSFPSNPCAQTAGENELKLLKTELLGNEKTLFDLSVELQKRVELINSKKSEEDYDQNEVADLMAGTANLTNEIEKLQIKRDSLAKKYEGLKSDLYIIYSAKIDSLRNSSLASEEKNQRIVKLIEKRLYVSPKIETLTFEPEKVLKIDITGGSAVTQIQREFLLSAKNEIELKLNEIEELKKEINTVIALNKETAAFLEEAEFDSDISYFKSGTESNRTSENAASGRGTYDEVENSLKTQTDTFSEILTQLNYNTLPDETTYSLSNILRNNDLEEFSGLIRDVESQLLDYITVIDNKLKNQ